MDTAGWQSEILHLPTDFLEMSSSVCTRLRNPFCHASDKNIQILCFFNSHRKLFGDGRSQGRQKKKKINLLGLEVNSDLSNLNQKNTKFVYFKHVFSAYFKSNKSNGY